MTVAPTRAQLYAFCLQQTSCTFLRHEVARAAVLNEDIGASIPLDATLEAFDTNDISTCMSARATSEAFDNGNISANISERATVKAFEGF